ncbi:MAG: hypothetical protein ACREEM_54600 [Blastocatellia bacterium]
MATIEALLGVEAAAQQVRPNWVEGSEGLPSVASRGVSKLQRVVVGIGARIEPEDFAELRVQAEEIVAERLMDVARRPASGN